MPSKPFLVLPPSAWSFQKDKPPKIQLVEQRKEAVIAILQETKKTQWKRLNVFKFNRGSGYNKQDEEFTLNDCKLKCEN